MITKKGKPGRPKNKTKGLEVKKGYHVILAPSRKKELENIYGTLTKAIETLPTKQTA